MTEKVIGILGGMGPEATLDLFGKIIAHTPAARDQDHLRVVIDSNPKVPDRTAAILSGGESPVPAMTAGIEALQAGRCGLRGHPLRVGAFLPGRAAAGGRRCRSCPCSTSRPSTSANDHPHIRTVGLLATTGTLQGRPLPGKAPGAGHRDPRRPAAAGPGAGHGGDLRDQGRSGRPGPSAIAAEIREIAGRLVAARRPGDRRGLHRNPAGAETRGSRRCPCSTPCRSWHGRRSPPPAARPLKPRLRPNDGVVPRFEMLVRAVAKRARFGSGSTRPACEHDPRLCKRGSRTETPLLSCQSASFTTTSVTSSSWGASPRKSWTASITADWMRSTGWPHGRG